MNSESRPLSIVAMLGAGVAGLRRYPGLWLALYIVQFAAAGLAAWIMARILAAEFGLSPVFDDAVAGDFPSLAFVLTDNASTFASLAMVGAAAAAGYAILSWYLIGGANAVLLQRPGTGHEVTHCFGAGGAATFFAYARLALWSLIPHALAIVAISVALSVVGDDLRYAVTGGDLAGQLVPALLPGAVLFWINVTVIDYARIELSRRAVANESLAAWRAILGAYRAILTDRRPLLHVLVYILFFAAISAVYVCFGSPSAGVAGAIALFVIRQLSLATRFAGKIVCAAGQVALAGSRAGSQSA